MTNFLPCKLNVFGFNAMQDSKLWRDLQLMGNSSILLVENIFYEIRPQLDPT